jgi:hypothetical protein
VHEKWCKRIGLVFASGCRLYGYLLLCNISAGWHGAHTDRFDCISFSSLVLVLGKYGYDNDMTVGLRKFSILQPLTPLAISLVLISYDLNPSYHLQMTKSYEPSWVHFDRALLHQDLLVTLGQREDVEGHGGLDLAPCDGDAEAGGLVGADGFAVGLNAHTQYVSKLPSTTTLYFRQVCQIGEEEGVRVP